MPARGTLASTSLHCISADAALVCYQNWICKRTEYVRVNVCACCGLTNMERKSSGLMELFGAQWAVVCLAQFVFWASRTAKLFFDRKRIMFAHLEPDNRTEMWVAMPVVRYVHSFSKRCSAISESIFFAIYLNLLNNYCCARAYFIICSTTFAVDSCRTLHDSYWKWIIMSTGCQAVRHYVHWLVFYVCMLCLCVYLPKVHYSRDPAALIYDRIFEVPRYSATNSPPEGVALAFKDTCSQFSTDWVNLFPCWPSKNQTLKKEKIPLKYMLHRLVNNWYWPFPLLFNNVPTPKTWLARYSLLC